MPFFFQNEKNTCFFFKMLSKRILKRGEQLITVYSKNEIQEHKKEKNSTTELKFINEIFNEWKRDNDIYLQTIYNTFLSRQGIICCDLKEIYNLKANTIESFKSILSNEINKDFNVKYSHSLNFLVDTYQILNKNFDHSMTERFVIKCYDPFETEEIYFFSCEIRIEFSVFSELTKSCKEQVVYCELVLNRFYFLYLLY